MGSSVWLRIRRRRCLSHHLRRLRYSATIMTLLSDKSMRNIVCYLGRRRETANGDHKLFVVVQPSPSAILDNEWMIQFSFYLYSPILFALLPLPQGLPSPMPLPVPCHVGIQVCHQDNSRFLC